MNDSHALQRERSLLTRRQLVQLGTFACGTAMAARALALESTDRISHSAESIHQEPVFAAKRPRLYRALTDAAQFDQVVALSAAGHSMTTGGQPAQISARAGGAFSLFGGYISGRFIELIPDALIVQAWRAGSWDRGIYSVARFEFQDKGGGSRVVFDHAGFPVGQADHLAQGWYANYWDPLHKLLT
ncbi:MAG TPA: SRPBCC domain-containing protein [Steroidobacteraceae bacterium]|nr:SRPBCC domain-containing protein [Steroidobacteraceae bacterium]